MPKPAVGAFRYLCVVSSLLSAMVATLANELVADAYCRATIFVRPGGDCVNEGAPLFWRNKCVGYVMTLPNSSLFPKTQVESVAANAFASWPKQGCAPSISGVYLGTSAAPVGYAQSKDNVNLVVFHETAWPHPDKGQVALTTLSFRKDTGEILDADIEVNATLPLSILNPVPSNHYDLLFVLTHEAGHMYGLAHSADPYSTMYFAYVPGSTARRSLTKDDATGMCEAYPADGRRATADGLVGGDACDPRAVPDPGTGAKGSSCSVSTARRDHGIAQILATAGVCVAWLMRRRSGRQRFSRR